jgi:hypothetical protein
MSDGIHYFNRCKRCNTLITKLQILKAFASDGVVCQCGSMMFGPSNALWYEWIYPRMLKMVVYQLLGKLDPAPMPSLPPMPRPTQIVAPLSPGEMRTEE